MAVEAGIEKLRIVGQPDAESALAIGSLVRLTHKFLVHEKAKEEPREASRVLQGFVLGARSGNMVHVDSGVKGTKPIINRTPTITYHLGEVMLESYDGQPRHETHHDIIFHAADPNYDFKEIPPVIN